MAEETVLILRQTERLELTHLQTTARQIPCGIQYLEESVGISHLCLWNI